MLEKIAADLQDDAPRQALAALLSEHGDPRGEFIALQLSGGSPKRLQKLSWQHGAAWTGSIAKLLRPHHDVFRRGFPFELSFGSCKAADVDAFGGDPIFATVERIDLDGMSELPGACLRDPVMRNVKYLGAVEWKAMASLLEWDSIPYESIDTSFVCSPDRVKAVLAARKRFSQLTSIGFDVGSSPPADWIWKSWLVELDELRLLHGTDELATWLSVLRRVDAPRVVITQHDQFGIAVEREDGELVATSQMPCQLLNPILATFDTAPFARLAVQRPSRKPELTSLQGHARRLGIELVIT